eukprot:3178560-Pleurochrysis_carterae.AAC.1
MSRRHICAAARESACVHTQACAFCGALATMSTRAPMCRTRVEEWQSGGRRKQGSPSARQGGTHRADTETEQEEHEITGRLGIAAAVVKRRYKMRRRHLRGDIVAYLEASDVGKPMGLNHSLLGIHSLGCCLEFCQRRVSGEGVRA